jgi:hypothetical protein
MTRPFSQSWPGQSVKISTLPPVLSPTAGHDQVDPPSLASRRLCVPSAPTFSLRLACSDGASNDKTVLIELQPHRATMSNTLSADVRRRSFVYFTDTTSAAIVICIFRPPQPFPSRFLLVTRCLWLTPDRVALLPPPNPRKRTQPPRSKITAYVRTPEYIINNV